VKRAKFAFAFGLVLAAVGSAGIAVSAQSDPYASGTAGYDVSYPNACGASIPGSAFGIVGVNARRPLTANGCISQQNANAATTGSASAYINTAYSGAYRKSITAACSSAPAGLTGSYAQAWEIGCSEADTSLKDAGSASPVAWWLDVETANSWSSSNFTLNDDAIRGAADRLHAVTAKSVGIYSTAGAWSTITRGANFSTIVDGEWDAGASACPSSGTKGFTGATIWLEQTGTSGGVDADSAC